MGLATLVLLFLLTVRLIPIKHPRPAVVTATFGVLVWGFQESFLPFFGSIRGFLALWLPFLVSSSHRFVEVRGVLARTHQMESRPGDNALPCRLGSRHRALITSSATIVVCSPLSPPSIPLHQRRWASADPLPSCSTRHRADTARAGDDEADGPLELVGTRAAAPRARAVWIARTGDVAAARRAGGECPSCYAAAGVGVISFDRSSLK